MQSPATNSNHGHKPSKLSVFLFGHNHEHLSSVKDSPPYSPEINDKTFNIDIDHGDDNHSIRSGSICFLF